VVADGAKLEEMLDLHRRRAVQGFTTNPTLMRQAGVVDYVAFASEVLAEIRDVPISFEVFADEFGEMERQARLITSWGENVYVKVPVTNTRGDSSRGIVTALSREGVKLNVTALLTVAQVREVVGFLSPSTPAIISVFAGRIADTGRDPVPIMTEAVRIARALPLAQVLWASPREVLNVYQAEQCGCHIVTATPAVLQKLKLRGKDLTELSRETVQMFYDDARQSGYSL
jgi:transaldolase